MPHITIPIRAIQKLGVKATSMRPVSDEERREGREEWERGVSGWEHLIVHLLTDLQP